jgi:hypothetical protein
MFAVGRALEQALLARHQPVLTHQPGGPVTPDPVAFIDKIAVQARAAMVLFDKAKAERMWARQTRS